MSEKSLSPENEARLRAAIADAGLETFADLIVARSVECAALETTEPDDYARVGNSRSGGVPDLPEDWDWPRSDDGLFFPFLAQINLAEVPRFTGNVLPARGMLYVFVCEDFDEVLIHYADVDPATLRRADEPDPSNLTLPEYEDLSPYRVSITVAPDVPYWTSPAHEEVVATVEENWSGPGEPYEALDALAEALRGGRSSALKLFGQAAYIGHTPEWSEYPDTPNPENGGVLLLTLNSDRKTGATYGDAGYQLIFADPAAVARGDFSRLTARTESS
jgi:hypothetical protein